MDNVVNFKVSGNELSAYIDNIKKKSDQLTESAIRGAVEQTSASKEQLKIINEQITAIEKKARVESEAAKAVAIGTRDFQTREAIRKQEEQRERFRKMIHDGSMTHEAGKNAIDSTYTDEKADVSRINSDHRESMANIREQVRQAKLQTQLSKDQIQTAKDAAKENIQAIIRGDKTLADVYREVEDNPSEEEKLTLRMIESGLADEKKKKKSGDNSTGFIGSLLTVDNANKLISSIGQLTQTQNGFDLIQPASSAAGRIIGGLIGGALGSLAGGIGAIGGAGIGAEIGGGLGDTIGALQQREALSKEAFFKSRNRYRSITGQNTDNMNITGMDDVGYSATAYLQSMSEYARRRGYSNGADKTTSDAIYADKGYGVDQGTSAAIIEMQRSSKENNRDLAGLIAGVLEKGKNTFFKNGDTTFLNEFLLKFTQLQKELLKTQSTVATGTTFDILSRFNSLGGEFATSDPRSAGLISTINNSLSNPNTDFKKALSFYALRKLHPDMNIADLVEEQQKGISSPQYLSSMMKMVNGMGGDEGFKRTNFAGLLGLEGNQKFATDIYNGFKSGKFNGNTSTQELSDYIGNFRNRASENTTQLEKNTASIENGILGGRAIEAMADTFVTAIKSMLGGAVINLNNGQGTITLLSKQAVGSNQTKSVENSKVEAQVNAINPFNGISTYLAQKFAGQ